MGSEIPVPRGSPSPGQREGGGQGWGGCLRGVRRPAPGPAESWVSGGRRAEGAQSPSHWLASFLSKWTLSSLQKPHMLVIKKKKKAVILEPEKEAKGPAARPPEEHPWARLGGSCLPPLYSPPRLLRPAWSATWAWDAIILWKLIDF